jgi:hypothetical protein
LFAVSAGPPSLYGFYAQPKTPEIRCRNVETASLARRVKIKLTNKCRKTADHKYAEKK